MTGHTIPNAPGGTVTTLGDNARIPASLNTGSGLSDAVNISAKNLASQIQAKAPALAIGPVVQSLSGAGITSDAAGQLGYQGTAPSTADQTAAINTIISNLSANSTGVELIWDVAVGVSGNVLIPSNFTLRAPNRACGAILRASSNACIMMNAGITTDSSTGKQNTFGKRDPNNLDGTLPSGWRYRVFDPAFLNNTNIKIMGGTWNGNQQAQGTTAQTFNATYGLAVSLRFWGVDNLELRDLYLISGMSFATFMINTRNVQVMDCEVDQSPTGRPSTDGIHFGGPSQRIRIQNLRTHCGDDNIAFNADDAADSFINSAFGVSTCVHGQNWTCGGDITQMEVDQHTIIPGNENGTGNGCLRIISSAHRVDGLVYRNGQGTTSSWAIPMGSYNAGGTNMLIPGFGNIGKIVFEDLAIDLVSPGGSGFDSGGVMSLGGNIELLEIRGRKRHNILSTAPDIYQNNNGTVQEIKLDGDYYDPAGATNNAAPVMQITGTTNRITGRVTTSRDSSLATIAAPVLGTTNGAAIAEVTLDVQADRVTNIVSNASGVTIGALRWTGQHSNSGGGAPVANAGTITNLQDGTGTTGAGPQTTSTFVAVAGKGYSGTAPTNYNAYSGP